MKREEILNLAMPPLAVETLAWGLCYVRHLRASDFDAVLDIFEEHEGASRLAALTILGLCDENGYPVLRREDLSNILEGALEPVTTLAAAFLELNGIESEEKKSGSGPVFTSDMHSPLNSATLGQNE